METLLIKRSGKILYAVAYVTRKKPGMLYLLAKDAKDARFQVLQQRRQLGHVVGIAPAIGAFTQEEERKRVYFYG